MFFWEVVEGDEVCPITLQAGSRRFLASGAQPVADIDALATRSERQIAVLAWNYHDDDLPGPTAEVRLSVAGIPANGPVLIEHYRIDETHSNSYTVWKQMGSPAKPTAEQYARMEAAGQLQSLRSPEWVVVKQGAVVLPFSLPRHAVSLVRIEW